MDFAQQLRRENAEIPDIYFLLFEAASISPTLILNQNAKAKERGSWVLFKIWTSEAAQAVHTGGAAYGFVRNLVKTSNLSVSKVRQFLHSKLCYTQFTLATRKFKQMKAFARFKKEIWFLGLAYVDKLAKDKNGVMYLLFCQGLFDRIADAKGMKTKDSKETVRAFLTMISKTNYPQKIGLTREQNLLESLKNYAKSKENKFTLQWVRPRLHLLNVQHNHSKFYFTVTWKTMDRNTSTNWLNSLQHKILEEIAR